MGYDVERYLNVRSAFGPSFGAGGSLAFAMDTTGVPQVWRLDGPRCWPEQLSFHDEPVGFVDCSPTREELVFGMDRGGDERTQFFRLSADGASEVDLTRDSTSSHQWGGWSHDGERFAFAANRRDDGHFDGYVQSRDERGEAATLVFDGAETGWLTAAGWNPDDDRIVFHEMHSNREHDLHVLDVEGGDVTHLTDDDGGEVRYGSLAWGPDGDVLYATTDREHDTLALGALDPATGEFTVVDEGGDWDVDAVAVDPDSRTMVQVGNVDGYSEIRLYELDGEGRRTALPTPDLPTGVLVGLSFSPDGERIAAAVSGPTRNPNVYVVARDTGECERWTAAPTAGIPRETFREPELVHYESFGVDGPDPSAREAESSGGLTVPAFLTLPAGDGPHPVIVDVHGGPESQRRPSFRALRQYYVDSGYAVFEPNVRGSSGYGVRYMNLDDVERRMDAVADLDWGVEWLLGRDDVDGERIVAYGGSYGGFMVLAALTEYPERWAAGVDVVGIANFVTFLENTGEWRREHREAEYGSLAEDREFLESISPVNRIERIRAPLLVLHGANDPRVPVEEAEQIAAKAAEHVDVETLIFDDEGHGFAKLENRITAYRAVVEFLDEHV